MTYYLPILLADMESNYCVIYVLWGDVINVLLYNNVVLLSFPCFKLQWRVHLILECCLSCNYFCKLMTFTLRFISRTAYNNNRSQCVVAQWQYFIGCIIYVQCTYLWIPKLKYTGKLLQFFNCVFVRDGGLYYLLLLRIAIMFQTPATLLCIIQNINVRVRWCISTYTV